jgi:hypothetical protein
MPLDPDLNITTAKKTKKEPEPTANIWAHSKFMNEDPLLLRQIYDDTAS